MALVLLVLVRQANVTQFESHDNLRLGLSIKR
ncbi:MAG: hypothetical protein JWM16_3554 [Verrucomicrobiales bacterium]|nr:hypothetical protein [Verrucomicrobiales bacterium]